MTTTLAPERYFELIDKDTERLLAVGERGLKEQVPACPGWDVAEVVWHVATVYEHKVRVMADNAWPDPWPPEWEFADDQELEFLRAAKHDLFEEFSRHDIAEQTTTFGADTTIGFWARRMACEIAIHRVDGEQAHDDVTLIDDDLATDGIDEILKVTVAGPWWAERVQTEHPVEARVAIESGGHRWLCDVQRQSITVADDPSTPAAATVSGTPDAVFRWLWGRADDGEVTFTGDEEVVREFRARIVECAG